MIHSHALRCSSTDYASNLARFHRRTSVSCSSRARFANKSRPTPRNHSRSSSLQIFMKFSMCRVASGWPSGSSPSVRSSLASPGDEAKMRRTGYSAPSRLRPIGMFSRAFLVLAARSGPGIRLTNGAVLALLCCTRSQSKQTKIVSKNQHTFVPLLLHNHDGVTERTPSISVDLSTTLYFLACSKIKSIFLDFLDRTKKRRSGPNEVGGKQNVNRPALVDIHSNSCSSPLATRPTLGEEPDVAVSAEMLIILFAQPPTVTNSNSSRCHARSGRSAKSLLKVKTSSNAGDVANTCRR